MKEKTLNLPEYERTVLAFLRGYKYCSNAINGKSVRTGCIIMMRTKADYTTAADEWSRVLCSATLDMIDADYAEVIKWVYTEDLEKIIVSIE